MALRTAYSVCSAVKQHQHSTMNILNKTEMATMVAKEGCGTDYTASGTRTPMCKYTPTYMGRDGLDVSLGLGRQSVRQAKIVSPTGR
jgi:hypothetical protein